MFKYKNSLKSKINDEWRKFSQYKKWRTPFCNQSFDQYVRKLLGVICRVIPYRQQILNI